MATSINEPIFSFFILQFCTIRSTTHFELDLKFKIHNSRKQQTYQRGGAWRGIKMAEKMKEFFQKKKLDYKFSKAGTGHTLNEERSKPLLMKGRFILLSMFNCYSDFSL